jgi:phosphoglycolate/pyridoxal phosphate phosphatase family enzyme
MAYLPDRLRLAIFDLDGVVYRGERPVPGAVELIQRLHAAGVLIRFATNNSMVARTGYVERLHSMGIATTVDEVVTSTWATAEHLRRSGPEVRRILAVGAPGMLDELRACGYEATGVADAAPAGYAGGPLAEAYDAVVVGLDPRIDYRRIAVAAAAVRAGARFVATNADRRYPTPEGFLPGAGSIVAAIAAACDVEPLVIGKPEPAMFRAILDAARIGPDEAVVIGDNPDADVVAARHAGIASVLVLTGVADRRLADGLDGERRPDAVADDPAAVAALLDGRLSG